MRKMLIRLDTSAVFMWCCIIWGSVSVRNAGGLTLVNRLQSFRRCKAVCSVLVLCLPATHREAFGHTSMNEMLWSFLSMAYLQDTVKRSVTGLPLICSKSSWHWFTCGISWSVRSQVYLWNVVKRSVNGLHVRYRETFGQTSTSEVS
jgi:hypothetical protein